jgi:hypothetical protein
MGRQKEVKKDDANLGPTSASEHYCPSCLYRRYMVDAARGAARGDNQAKPRFSRTSALHFVDDCDRFDSCQLFSRLFIMVDTTSVSLSRRVNITRRFFFFCLIDNAYIFGLVDFFYVCSLPIWQQ